jgi:UDP-N-acetylmuramate dehydrogenase
MSDNLQLVEILQQGGQVESWAADRLEYGYRDSSLKGCRGDFVVVTATLKLFESTPEACKSKIHEYQVYRERTQPTGASMGSIFKNPPDDYAGRLIDQSGLKGTRVGGVRVSEIHANFFINEGGATAEDMMQLIERVRDEVAMKHSVELELEIELVGDWGSESELDEARDWA